MSDIHIQSVDSDKQREILEYLATKNVTLAVLPEADPQIHQLWLDGRRNDKLDNLGQLRHLFKIEGHLRELIRWLVARSDRETQRNFDRRQKFGDYLQMRCDEEGLEMPEGTAYTSAVRRFGSYEDVEAYIRVKKWREFKKKQ